MTAIEYGLICALVALAILGAAMNVGGRLQHTFHTIDAHLAPIAVVVK